MYDLSRITERVMHEKRAEHFSKRIADLMQVMTLQLDKDFKDYLEECKQDEIRRNHFGTYFPDFTLNSPRALAEFVKKHPKHFVTFFGEYYIYVNFEDRDALCRVIAEYLASRHNVEKMLGAVERYPNTISFNGEL